MAKKKKTDFSQDDYYRCRHCKTGLILVRPVIRMDGIYLMECPSCQEREYKHIEPEQLQEE